MYAANAYRIRLEAGPTPETRKRLAERGGHSRLPPAG